MSQANQGRDVAFRCHMCGTFNRQPLQSPLFCVECDSERDLANDCLILDHVEPIKQPTPFTREDYIASLRRIEKRRMSGEEITSRCIMEEIFYLESL